MGRSAHLACAFTITPHFAVFLSGWRRAAQLGSAALLCLLVLTARAQAPSRVFAANHNLWLVLNSEARFSDRWGARGELIYRRASWAQALQQVQLRLAPTWNPRPDLQLSVGYLFSRNYRYGDFPVLRTFNEHRSYQQVLLRSAFGRFALAHRYRLEQRWQRPALAADPSRFATVYTNRARYQARLTRPLRQAALGPYAAASGEVFVSFGARVAANIFDQGRAYAGVGWQFTPGAGAELGYLQQVIAQGNGRVFERNHTLQLTLLLNPDWSRATTPADPQTDME